jgi:hypothetical protein
VGAPVIVEPQPVVVSQPVVVPQPAVVSQPVVTTPAPAPAPAPAAVAPPQPTGNVFYQGIVSRKSKIAYKEALTIDGIVVKIKDTDRCPLDADIELRMDCFKEKYKDLPIGSSIAVVGRSGQTYWVNLLDIDDGTETISFAVVQ